jgi:cobalt-zinc-cadmium resistance protein CzcA
VILIENVHRHLSYRDPEVEGMQAIVMESAGEVVGPIFFSTMVIFVSFIPLFTMQGVEGKIFGPMALTYALALAAALLLALSFSPAAATMLMKGGGDHSKDTFLVRLLRPPYLAVVRAAVHARVLVVGLAVTALALTAVLILPRLGGEFMPKLEEGNLWVRATMPTSISYTEASKLADGTRKVFLDCPQVITCVSQLGRPDDGSDPTSFFNCEFYVPLIPQSQWPAGTTKDDIIAKLNDKLAAMYPGIEFNFSQAIEDNVEEAMSGVKGENSSR